MDSQALLDTTRFQFYADIASCIATVLAAFTALVLAFQWRNLNRTTKHNTTKSLRESLAHLNDITQAEHKSEQQKEIDKCIHRFNYFQSVQDAWDNRLISKDEWDAQERYMREAFIGLNMYRQWACNRDIYTQTLMATLDKLLPDGFPKDFTPGVRREGKRPRHEIRDEYGPDELPQSP